MPRNILRPVSVSFGVLLGLLIATTLIAWNSQRELVSVNDSVVDTDEAIDHLDSIPSLVVTADRRQRFILTEDQRMLAVIGLVGLIAVAIGGQVVRRNLSARARSAAALLASERQFRERQFRELVHALPAAVYACDADGRITIFNDAAVALWGRTPAAGGELWCGSWKVFELDGRPLPPEECPMAVTIRQDQPVRGREMVVERPDGSRVRVLPHPRALRDAAGVVTGGVTMLVDVTATRQAEREIRELNASIEQRVADRTAALTAANQELDAFSYSVSHDLRAPLRSIDGFSRILITEHADELSPAARQYLQLVRNSTQQMGQLVADLLAFSRLSRQPLRKEVVWPDAVIHQCLALLHAETEGRRLDLSIGDLPACEADAGLLKLVWMNLLSNALKYSRRRDPARIEIGCHQDGTTVYFIRDNGVGFNMAYADQLFGVFQRLHRAEDYEGTGVGLASVNRIVRRHGGRVWAEAELNRGATFFFTLDPETPS